NAANNSTSGTLTVVSGGRFSSVSVSSTDLRQEWFNLLGSAAFPAESLSLQNVQVNQLALTVVPSQAVIGTFTLKGTVISGATTFPTGTVTGTLHQAAVGAPCELVSGFNVAFTNTPAGFP